MKKLAAFMAAASVAGSVVTGCGLTSAGSAAQKAGQESPAAGEAAGETAGSAVHVGIIFTEAGLGGNSFNDLALEGVKKAALDFGITYDEVEPKSVSDEEIIQDEMASSGDYDLIICVGAEQVAKVASYSCKEQEGAFLAGALAALAKKEAIDSKMGDGRTIGFIGGVDNPLINRFAAGYQAGARYIEPEMNVLIDYAGGFNDPTTAKTIANTFVEKGADVIFHAAGASGMGMFQAAEEKGFVAIGVNLNQNSIAPDFIMASMLKKLDSCAYHAIASVVEGTYTGENQMLGLSDGGVDVTVEESNIKVTDDMLARLEELKQKVIAGEIEVPSELN